MEKTSRHADGTTQPLGRRSAGGSSGRTTWRASCAGGTPTNDAKRVNLACSSSSLMRPPPLVYVVLVLAVVLPRCSAVFGVLTEDNDARNDERGQSGHGGAPFRWRRSGPKRTRRSATHEAAPRCPGGDADRLVAAGLAHGAVPMARGNEARRADTRAGAHACPEERVPRMRARLPNHGRGGGGLLHDGLTREREGS